jgi:hypothetical protein
MSSLIYQEKQGLVVPQKITICRTAKDAFAA